ncbi:MAG: thioredoxin [Burkholderiales bacterium]|nr:thioredoxin [Burkholderiales bacterium]
MDFQRDILDASATTPVVVDFWAPWCGPCRALGPILEKLEREYAGRFRLVKVNSDENQELAAAFNVRSIPYVVAFRGGKPVAQFVGALPEGQVRTFIEKLFPSVHEDNLAEVEKLINAGKHEDAEKLLDTMPPNIDWDARVEALRAAIGFARGGGDEAALAAKLAADPRDLEARLALARLHAGRRRYREAMEALVEIVRMDKNWRDGEARTQLLHLFTLAAGEPDLVSEYRRKLATALY